MLYGCSLLYGFTGSTNFDLIADKLNKDNTGAVLWQTIINFYIYSLNDFGAVAAIGQKNIKRLLAYSSIGHIGYTLAGVATGVIAGYESAIVYISIYVVMNIGAFSCLYLFKKDGQYKENISDLSGISKKTHY